VPAYTKYYNEDFNSKLMLQVLKLKQIILRYTLHSRSQIIILVGDTSACI